MRAFQCSVLSVFGDRSEIPPSLSRPPLFSTAGGTGGVRMDTWVIRTSTSLHLWDSTPSLKKSRAFHTIRHHCALVLGFGYRGRSHPNGLSLVRETL